MGTQTLPRHVVRGGRMRVCTWLKGDSQRVRSKTCPKFVAPSDNPPVAIYQLKWV